MSSHSGLLSPFITKTVQFKFRGINFTFALSQGLFSSADVDSGTKLLLKVFSNVLDDDATAGAALPTRALDAGCGTGVIGICAAAALATQGARVRCQDRDELARLITAHNAALNRIPPEALEALAEPLLAGPPGARWDLILTNIPAKAGLPVLEDFARRSIALLNENGKVIMVAVHTLADFFRQAINAAGARILREEKGSEHRVFVYSKKTEPDTQSGGDTPAHEALAAGPGFLTRYPFYRRANITIDEIEMDDTPLHIETVYGASGFDCQIAAERAALTLIEKLEHKLFPDSLPETGSAENAAQPILIHEPGQGFFPCQLHALLRSRMPTRGTASELPRMVLSGRNILTLEAARDNYGRYADSPCVTVPAADLQSAATALRAAAESSAGLRGEAGNEGRYGLIIAFPELLPQSVLPKGVDQLASLWESIPPLLCPGGVCIAGFGSTDAERFDRKKPAGFTRLGSIKRDGCRCLAYRICVYIENCFRF